MLNFLMFNDSNRTFGLLCITISCGIGSIGDILLRRPNALSINNDRNFSFKTVGIILSSILESVFILFTLIFISAAVTASFIGFRCLITLIVSRVWLNETLSRTHYLASALLIIGLLGVINFDFVAHSNATVTTSTSSTLSSLDPLFEALSSTQWILFLVFYLICLLCSLYILKTSLKKNSTYTPMMQPATISHQLDDSQIPGLFEIETETGFKDGTMIAPSITPQNSNQWSVMESIEPSTQRKKMPISSDSAQLFQERLSNRKIFQYCFSVFQRLRICLSHKLNQSSTSPSFLLFGSAVAPGLFGSLAYLLGDITLKSIYHLGWSAISDVRLIVLILLSVMSAGCFPLTLRILSDLYDKPIVMPIANGTLIIFTALGNCSLWISLETSDVAVIVYFAISSVAIVWGIALSSKAELMNQIAGLRFAAAELTESAIDIENENEQCQDETNRILQSSYFPNSQLFGKSTVKAVLSEEDNIEKYIDELEVTLKESSYYRDSTN